MTNANEKYLYVTELLYNVWLLIPRGLRWLRVLSPFSLHLLFVCLDYVKKKKKKKCCYIDAHRGKTLTEAALFQKVNKLEKYMYTHSKQGQALLPKNQKN